MNEPTNKDLEAIEELHWQDVAATKAGLPFTIFDLLFTIVIDHRLYLRHKLIIFFKTSGTKPSPYVRKIRSTNF